MTRGVAAFAGSGASALLGAADGLKSEIVDSLKREFRSAEVQAHEVEERARDYLQAMEQLALKRFEALSRFLLELEAAQLNGLREIGRKLTSKRKS